MSLRMRLFISHALVALLSLIALTVAVLVLLGEVQRNIRLQTLGGTALNIVRNARALPGLIDNRDVLFDRLTRAARNNATVRVMVTDPRGLVLLDSVRAADASMTGRTIALTDKPSMITLPGEVEAADDFRDPQRRQWIFVGMPTDSAANSGATLPGGLWIVLAQPLRNNAFLNAVDDEVGRPVLQGALISMLLAALVAALVARSLSKPIQRVTLAANAIAQGDYAQRVSPQGPNELRALAEDFNRMAGRVQQSQATERDFVANVSHELKTPLTSIKGFAQAILDGTTATPEQTLHAAGIIYNESERLTRMVNELLDSARLESGDLPLVRGATDVGALAQQAVERFAMRASQQNTMLNASVTPGTRAWCDADRILQVIVNLVDNALKHTQAGLVTVEARPVAKGVELAVIDTGRGIPPEDLPRIFERFYMVEKSREASLRGTGLGLSICKQIIEAHGGTIEARSKPGVGTTIRLWLPAQAA